MIQLTPFNTSKGGNAPLKCLENVSLGFSIGAKYPDAWTAWEHTEQHFDPIPTGLDVPLYYSYTTTIDGITKNYGHINVRLKTGTVWSDGNIYASLEAYESNHFPKYVGWGESVNNVKIIGVDMITKEQEIVCAEMQTGSPPGVNYNYQFTGLPLTQTNLDKMLQFWSSQPRPAPEPAPPANVTKLSKGFYEVS